MGSKHSQEMTDGVKSWGKVSPECCQKRGRPCGKLKLNFIAKLWTAESGKHLTQCFLLGDLDGNLWLRALSLPRTRNLER